MSRRGRKRNANVARETNGRAKRTQPQQIMPDAGLAQRAVMLGLDPASLTRHGSAAVAAICADATAGTALGRIAYRYFADGTRQRRTGVFDYRLEAWITTDMEAAAEAYRALWVRWYRALGLPRRHPQGQQFERVPSGEDAVDDLRDYGGLFDRMTAVENALAACGHASPGRQGGKNA
ncbi:hypothetical protein [Paramagnetospirillum magneticum]|uniref:Uncharacterized protein n=1 Tax=Paramagnetospirillum magneticum (strain ATCC 700264 / AMB-1) TaxID=342108 RepID=Q2W3P8_PARM1|nr:hypothetical protein [Paramagnetospirillum magneticum]BAE51527.1 hypothetical protein amb2723 [Paramagnetospirillum magneticum AMB-1]